MSVAVAVALAVAATPLPARAQAQLADPTRPPPEARLAAYGAAGPADSAPVRSGPQLQSVLNGSHGRQVAVIDGQTLRVGDRIDGATLVQVGADRVVLQHGRARRVLTLSADPAAAKNPRAPHTAPEN